MPKKPVLRATASKLPVIQEVDESKDIYLKKEWFIQAKKEAVLKRYTFANVNFILCRKSDRAHSEKFIRLHSLALT